MGWVCRLPGPASELGVRPCCAFFPVVHLVNADWRELEFPGWGYTYSVSTTLGSARVIVRFPILFFAHEFQFGHLRERDLNDPQGRNLLPLLRSQYGSRDMVQFPVMDTSPRQYVALHLWSSCYLKRWLSGYPSISVDALDGLGATVYGCRTPCVHGARAAHACFTVWFPLAIFAID